MGTILMGKILMGKILMGKILMGTIFKGTSHGYHTLGMQQKLSWQRNYVMCGYFNHYHTKITFHFHDIRDLQGRDCTTVTE